MTEEKKRENALATEFRFAAPTFEDYCPERFDDENITPVDVLDVGWAARATEEKILRLLFGIVSGIVADGEINADEFSALFAWRREHSNEALTPGLRPVFQKFDDVLADGVLTFAEALELLDAIGERLGSWTRYRPETTAVQMLLGLTQGALADRSITRGELQTFCDWFDALGEYRSDATFAGVERAVRRAAADFTPEAESELIRELEDYVAPCRNLPTDAEVQFEAKRFVLSGRFAFGKKRDVADEIAKRGGEVASKVTPKVDYLIVGGEKSVLWKYDNYGCKVDEARRLKEEGLAIEILGEGELLNAFETAE